MADTVPIEVCSALLTKTEGAASNGYIAETATTLTADDILLLADGPAGPRWVEPTVLGEDGKALFRHNPATRMRRGEGPLSTCAVTRRHMVNMPSCCCQKFS